MKVNRLLSALFTDGWMIEDQYAGAQLPFLERLISGKEDSKKKAEIHAWHYHDDQLVKNKGEFSEAPAGSIAIIDIDNPILKHDNCGDPGSISLAGIIQRADQDSRISSILLRIDSPGGQVSGLQTFTDAITACNKPIFAFINDGMAASAAYWIAACCNEIWSSHATNAVGSIGVYTRLADQSKHLSLQGIEVHEIYADQSSEKNGRYRDALKGNYSELKKDLNFTANTFIKAVRINRSEKLNFSAQNDPFKGKLFNSIDALENGLIDKIGSFQQCVQALQQFTNSN